MSEEEHDGVGADGLTDEARSVRKWRYDEARAAGMSIAEAQLFRDSNIDVGELRRLVNAKCPADLLAKVIL